MCCLVIVMFCLNKSENMNLKTLISYKLSSIYVETIPSEKKS